MSEAKHTPGPWRYDATRSVESPCILSDAIDPETGQPFCVVSLGGAMGGEDTNADARPIAAAPDLLRERDIYRAALEEIVNASTWAKAGYLGNIARAAIAKATP
ncbi:MAG: hypothetical protein ACPGVG_13055 [Mycobacterium sp.]